MANNWHFTLLYHFSTCLSQSHLFLMSKFMDVPNDRLPLPQFWNLRAHRTTSDCTCTLPILSLSLVSVPLLGLGKISGSLLYISQLGLEKVFTPTLSWDLCTWKGSAKISSSYIFTCIGTYKNIDLEGDMKYDFLLVELETIFRILLLTISIK